MSGEMKELQQAAWRSGWAACWALVAPIREYVESFEDPSAVDIEKVRRALEAVWEVDVKGGVSEEAHETAATPAPEQGWRLYQGSDALQHVLGGAW